MIPAHSEVLPNLVGTVQDQPVFYDTGPLIANPRVLSQTERCIRDVLPEEWCSLKGCPKTWTPPKAGVERLLQQPITHVLSTLGQVMSRIVHPDLTSHVPNTRHFLTP
jgi:hypothetical protein